jgi:hypothetical protein
MRWRRKPTATAPAPPPESVWDDVVTVVSALDERDRARDLAVRLECENAHLIGFLHYMRDDLEAGGRTLLTIDDLIEAIDMALADVTTEDA